MFRKYICSIVSFCFFLQCIGVFADDTTAFKTSEKKQSSLSVTIPPEYGFIKERFQGESPFTIIHIRDLHCNYPAQKNIARILEFLSHHDDQSIDTAASLPVFVEGATGPVDTSFYGRFPFAQVKDEVFTEYMKKGLVTGPEYLSIMRYPDHGFFLHGIEDESLYVTDFFDFRKTYMERKTQEYFTDLFVLLTSLKEKIFSQELRQFDLDCKNHLSGKTGTRAFIGILSEVITLSKNIFPNIALFQEVSVLNDRIDPALVDNERLLFFEKLEGVMPKDDISRFVKINLQFRLGRITDTEYYTYISELADTYSLSLHDFPQTAAYISYLKTRSQLDYDELLTEIDRARSEAKTVLLISDEEKNLAHLDRYAELLRNLVILQLTRADYREYRDVSKILSPEILIRELKALTEHFDEMIPYSLSNQSLVQQLIEKISFGEDFYSVASKRDAVMLKNALDVLAKTNAQQGCIITGGFHSAGILSLLREKKISYVVITPKTDGELNEEVYLSLMLDKRIKERQNRHVFALAFMSLFNGLMNVVSETFKEETTRRLLNRLVDHFLVFAQQNSSAPAVLLQQWFAERLYSLNEEEQQWVSIVRERLNEVDKQRLSPLSSEEIKTLLMSSKTIAEWTLKYLRESGADQSVISDALKQYAQLYQEVLIQNASLEDLEKWLESSMGFISREYWEQILRDNPLGEKAALVKASKDGITQGFMLIEFTEEQVRVVGIDYSEGFSAIARKLLQKAYERSRGTLLIREGIGYFSDAKLKQLGFIKRSDSTLWELAEPEKLFGSIPEKIRKTQPEESLRPRETRAPGLMGNWVPANSVYPTKEDPFLKMDLVGINKNEGLIRENVRIKARKISLNAHEDIIFRVREQLMPLAQVIQDTEKREQTLGVLLHILNNLDNIWLIEDHPDVYGFADKGIICVNEHLFDSEVRMIALFHEAGHSYYDRKDVAFPYGDGVNISPHQYLRGLGREKRKGRKTVDLRPEEKGLQDELFGDLNIQLSDEIRRRIFFYQYWLATNDEKRSFSQNMELAELFAKRLDNSGRVLIAYPKLLRAVNILLNYIDSNKMTDVKQFLFHFYTEDTKVEKKGEVLEFLFQSPELLSTADALAVFSRDLGWDFASTIRILDSHGNRQFLLDADDFEAINVILHHRMAGMGDLVFVVNTGQTLKRAFPAKKVRVVFHSADDFNIVCKTQFIAGLDPDLAIQEVEGVEFVNASRYKAADSTAESAWQATQNELFSPDDVSVIYALGHDEKEVFGSSYGYDRYVGKAKKAVVKMVELGFESPFMDPMSSGFLNIGFGRSTAGMAPVSPDVQEIYSAKYPRDNQQIRKDRRRILKKLPGWKVLDETLGQKDLSRTIASEWGFLYAHEDHTIRKYFAVFEQSRKTAGNLALHNPRMAQFTEDDKTFFVMCSKNDLRVQEEVRKQAQENNYNLFIYSDDEDTLQAERIDPDSKITIIMDFSVPRTLFSELFLYSDDLPTVVSGQDNLANILFLNLLSSGRPFFWETLIFQGTSPYDFKHLVQQGMGKDASDLFRLLWPYPQDDLSVAAEMFFAPRKWREFFKEVAQTVRKENNAFVPQVYYMILRQLADRAFYHNDPEITLLEDYQLSKETISTTSTDGEPEVDPVQITSGTIADDEDDLSAKEIVQIDTNEALLENFRKGSFAAVTRTDLDILAENDFSEKDISTEKLITLFINNSYNEAGSDINVIANAEAFLERYLLQTVRTPDGRIMSGKQEILLMLQSLYEHMGEDYDFRYVIPLGTYNVFNDLLVLGHAGIQESLKILLDKTGKPVSKVKTVYVSRRALLNTVDTPELNGLATLLEHEKADLRERKHRWRGDEEKVVREFLQRLHEEWLQTHFPDLVKANRFTVEEFRKSLEKPLVGISDQQRLFQLGIRIALNSLRKGWIDPLFDFLSFHSRPYDVDYSKYKSAPRVLDHGKVEFNYYALEGSEVYVTGDFENWTGLLRMMPTEDTEDRDLGTFIRYTRVVDGLTDVHAFKFVVDHQWIPDDEVQGITPYYEETIVDGDAVINSLVWAPRDTDDPFIKGILHGMANSLINYELPDELRQRIALSFPLAILPETFSNDAEFMSTYLLLVLRNSEGFSMSELSSRIDPVLEVIGENPAFLELIGRYCSQSVQDLGTIQFLLEYLRLHATPYQVDQEKYPSMAVVKGNGEVEFNYYTVPDAQSVYVVGDFTNWMASPIRLRPHKEDRRGDMIRWSVTCKGLYGPHSYKFRVKRKKFEAEWASPELISPYLRKATQGVSNPVFWTPRGVDDAFIRGIAAGLLDRMRYEQNKNPLLSVLIGQKFPVELYPDLLNEIVAETRREKRNSEQRTNLQRGPPSQAKESIFYVSLRNFKEEGISGIQGFINWYKEHLIDSDGQSLFSHVLICPPFEIGRENRKGTAGSPWSVKDFTKVDSEIGTVEELQQGIKTLQELGVQVVLDLPWHSTAYDHPLVKEHPEWYQEPSKEFKERYGDIYPLAINNPEVLEYLLQTITRIIDTFGFDGLRFDGVHILETSGNAFNWLSDRVRKRFPRMLIIGEGADPALFNTAQVIYGWDILNTLGKVLMKRDELTYYDVVSAFQRYEDHVGLGKLLMAIRTQDNTFGNPRTITSNRTLIFGLPRSIPSIWMMELLDGKVIGESEHEGNQNRQVKVDKFKITGNYEDEIALVSKILTLRKEYPALVFGDYEVLTPLGTSRGLGAIVYQRTLGQQGVLVAGDIYGHDNRIDIRFPLIDNWDLSQEVQGTEYWIGDSITGQGIKVSLKTLRELKSAKKFLRIKLARGYSQIKEGNQLIEESHNNTVYLVVEPWDESRHTVLTEQKGALSLQTMSTTRLIRRKIEQVFYKYESLDTQGRLPNRYGFIDPLYSVYWHILLDTERKKYVRDRILKADPESFITEPGVDSASFETLFNFLKTYAGVRGDNPGLLGGDLVIHQTTHDTVNAFSRGFADHLISIVMNIGSSQARDVAVSYAGTSLRPEGRYRVEIISINPATGESKRKADVLQGKKIIDDGISVGIMDILESTVIKIIPEENPLDGFIHLLKSAYHELALSALRNMFDEGSIGSDQIFSFLEVSTRDDASMLYGLVRVLNQMKMIYSAPDWSRLELQMKEYAPSVAAAIKQQALLNKQFGSLDTLVNQEEYKNMRRISINGHGEIHMDFFDRDQEELFLDSDENAQLLDSLTNRQRKIIADSPEGLEAGLRTVWLQQQVRENDLFYTDSLLAFVKENTSQVKYLEKPLQLFIDFSLIQNDDGTELNKILDYLGKGVEIIIFSNQSDEVMQSYLEKMYDISPAMITEKKIRFASYEDRKEDVDILLLESQGIQPPEYERVRFLGDIDKRRNHIYGDYLDGHLDSGIVALYGNELNSLAHLVVCILTLKDRKDIENALIDAGLTYTEIKEMLPEDGRIPPIRSTSNFMESLNAEKQKRHLFEIAA